MRVRVPTAPAAIAAGVLALLCGPAPAQDRVLSPEDIYERAAPSVWLVETDHGDGNGSIGSAVVIAPGTLITNCHVLDKAKAIAVSHTNRDRRRMAARLQHRDPARDLCQLRADGVAAPAVEVAPVESLRPGSKVYAIGNPRGLELTISDGLLSGLRRDAAGVLQRLQISVPISPGSSGGGLFDARGRLIGITTSGRTDAQNINFALPATWIAELPQRAGDRTVAAMPPAAGPAPAPAAPPAIAQPEPPAAPADAPPAVTAVAGFNVFEYRLLDRLTGVARPVVFRIDRREGTRLVMNGGARLEEAGGRVLADSAHLAGEFDTAMPPGGWVHAGTLQQRSGRRTYESAGDARPFHMELEAETLGEDTLVIRNQVLRTVRVRFKGYTSRGGGAINNPPGAYLATAWYAPALDRVVRFEARTRGGVGLTAFVVDEVLELVDMR